MRIECGFDKAVRNSILKCFLMQLRTGYIIRENLHTPAFNFRFLNAHVSNLYGIDAHPGNCSVAGDGAEI